MDKFELIIQDELKISGANIAIAAYVKAYKIRYNHSPILSGKDHKAMKRLCTLDGLNPERVATLAAHYINMSDKWFLTMKHDITTFEMRINSVLGDFREKRRILTQKREENFQALPEPEETYTTPEVAKQKMIEIKKKLGFSMNNMPTHETEQDTEKRLAELRKQARELSKKST
jgi:hypothetical protein